MNYTPLNVQSGYSLLSSALRVEDIVLACKLNNHSACGIADLSNCFGFPTFDRQLRKAGIKPLLGVNILIDGKALVLYIKNEKGYLNLCQILALNNPTKKDIENKLEGLIAILPMSSLSDVNEDELPKICFSLLSGFEDSYIGIEFYSRDDKNKVKAIRDFAASHSYETVAFPKHLYIKKEDALILKIVNAIKNEEKLKLDDSFSGPYYFLSERGISTLYTKEEIEASNKIAELVDFEFFKKRGQLLSYPLESILSKKKFIYFQCISNAKLRGITLDERYLTRLNYEIDVIEKMGYLDYFLIVSDYVNYAKKAKIPVGPGRGSAAGALISYLLGITEVDPLKYDLMFERFLNPGRVTMPDIDIDIGDIYRTDVYNYIAKKYKKNQMCYIVTFQEIGPKQSFRDIGRVFSINQMDINNLSNAVSRYDTLDEAIKNSDTLKSLKQDSYFNRIIELATKISGLPRQTSIHPAGIILNEQDITEVLPTFRSEQGLIAEVEKDYIEDLGFLKMDILGLRNLTLIDDIEKLIKINHLGFSLEKIPLDDQKTFNVLNAGFTQYLFQLESEGITQKLKQVKVNCFEDLVALLALYRPGPMDNIPLFVEGKNHPDKVKYLHPLLEKTLKSTYGVIVYQEQIMQIVQDIAGFSLGEADLFRRAISKKDASKLESLKKSFLDGAKNNGVDDTTALKIFELIDKFANYGFNRSHSVAYALITYRMAYLKANYSKEFYCVVFNGVALGSSSYRKILQELKIFNLSLKAPSVNLSTGVYQIKGDSLVIPFTAIKGLPSSLGDAVEFERKSNGPFLDVDNFVARMHDYKISEDNLSKMIDAGVFDEFGHSRLALHQSIKAFMQYADLAYSSISLFDNSDSFRPLITDNGEDENMKLQREFEVLGIMLSGSPLKKYEKFIREHHVKSVASLMNSQSDVMITIFVNELREVTTKKKELMGIIHGFDGSMDIDVILFKDAYSKYKKVVYENECFAFKGYFRNDVRGLSFIANEVIKMEE